MADPLAIDGSKIFIGGVKALQAADFTESSFTGEVWVEIDGLETLGVLGDTSNIITTNLINRSRAVKQKGSRDAGDMENRFIVINGDAGQAAARAAEATKSNYAFKIEYPLQSGESTPRTKLWAGMIASWREQNGVSDAVQIVSVTIGANSNIVDVAAT